MRPWPHSPHVAHLVFSGGHEVLPDGLQGAPGVPDVPSVRAWIPGLLNMGYRSVRTGAVAPDLAERLQEAGFATVQNLTLLSTTLPAPPVTTVDPTRREVISRLWRTGGRRLQESLRVDNLAFGAEWSFDASTLRDAVGATGHCVFLVASEPRQPVHGFVVAGATGSTGYVQRLAVDPARRRVGTASRLLHRAHAWMTRRGCRTSVVNTEDSNHAALALYRGFGYEPLPYGLRVLELALGDSLP